MFCVLIRPSTAKRGVSMVVAVIESSFEVKEAVESALLLGVVRYS
jgi:hypothetical protein